MTTKYQMYKTGLWLFLQRYSKECKKASLVKNLFNASPLPNSKYHSLYPINQTTHHQEIFKTIQLSKPARLV